MIHELPEMGAGDMGQYAHGNQPIQHMPYLYNWVGQPWKTQTRVREVMYRPVPGMYCSDEDNGQASAWYAFSTLGFYPVAPGTNPYSLGSPIFSKATLRLKNGQILSIEAQNQSPKHVYVQSVSRNGKPVHPTDLTREELTKGGRLVFEISAKPNLKRGVRPEDRPYSMSLGPDAVR